MGFHCFRASQRDMKAPQKMAPPRRWTNQCGNKRSRLFNKSWPRSDGCPFRV
jgi:hypothetical protein